MAKGKKTGGRTEGTPNKKSLDLEAVLESHDYDPLDSLINKLKRQRPTHAKIVAEYKKAVTRCRKIHEKPPTLIQFMNFMLDGTFSAKEQADLEIKLMKHIYPTKKAIETKVVNENTGYNLNYDVGFDPSEDPDFTGVDDE